MNQKSSFDPQKKETRQKDKETRTDRGVLGEGTGAGGDKGESGCEEGRVDGEGDLVVRVPERRTRGPDDRHYRALRRHVFAPPFWGTSIELGSNDTVENYVGF